jgi:hypothetical protein
MWNLLFWFINIQSQNQPTNMWNLFFVRCEQESENDESRYKHIFKFI